MQTLITYATTTGNTEKVAENLYEYIQNNHSHLDAVLVDMEDLEPGHLTNYELVFIGSSTWGEGAYNEVSEEFFEKLTSEKIDLSTTKFAIFGLGEKTYENFCSVVDLMGKTLQSCGGEVMKQTLKIDGFPDDAVMKSAQNWLDSIIGNF